MKRFSVFAVLIAILLTGCSKSVEPVSKDITVVVTSFPIYDWTKTILGDTEGITLKYLVDSSVDLHSYQPSASDIVEYRNADLVICFGGESERWVYDVVDSPSKILSLINCVSVREEEIIEGMEPEDEEESEGPEIDEHIWLSVKNAAICVRTISDYFINLNKTNEMAYHNNTEAYLNALNKLDLQYENAVLQADMRTVLFGDRFPFRYLVDDYGLKYYAAFTGCSAESEASFETIAFLSEKIDELGLKAVCVIGNDHSIAESVISNTKEKNQTIVELNSMQSISNKEADNYSYLDIMTENLDSLKKALEK